MSKKKGFGKFLLGASIGAGLGLLLTKKTGEENRKVLKEKANELLEKAKKIDAGDIAKTVELKVNEIIDEVSNLDKETALKLAKEKSQKLINKSEELLEYVVEKGTPVMEKTATLLRKKIIEITKDTLEKLEKEGK